jgi:hypothetical protein
MIRPLGRMIIRPYWTRARTQAGGAAVRLLLRIGEKSHG